MVRIYLSRFLQSMSEDESIKDICAGFKSYKTTQNPGTLFGRDASLDRPSCAKLSGLQHVHILDEMESFSSKNIKVVRLEDQYDRTSDSFLIYCQGINDRRNYLLIDIIWFDAHETTRDYLRVIQYADEAERFYKSGK